MKKGITLLYTQGTSEATGCLQKPLSIRVTHKPIGTLRSALSNGKDLVNRHDQSGVAYVISCIRVHRRDMQAITHPST